MPDAKHTHPLITVSRVKGTAAYDKAGEKIGHVQDLSIDKVSGQVRYALLSFGGFLGIGERYHPLPWSVLTYDVDKMGYVVPLDEAALKAAPSYSEGELEAFGAGDQDYRDAIFAYYAQYGAMPYWP